MWPRTTKTPKTIRNSSAPKLEMLEDRYLLDGGLGNSLPTPFGSEAAFKDFLISKSLDQYKDLFGQHYIYNPIYYFDSVSTPERGVPAQFIQTQTDSAPIGSLQLAGASSTGTNVQVAGVDEADIVKTDGKYLYHLAHQELNILSVSPNLSLVSQTPIEGQPIAEYLTGSRLLVISYLPTYDIPLEDGSAASMRIWHPASNKTKITLFDVSKPDAPQVVQSTFFDGSYLESRAVGNNVYLVAQNYTGYLPAPGFTSFNGETIYDTKEAYLARISGNELNLALPHYYHKDADGKLQDAGLMVDAARLYQPTSSDQYTLVTELTFDMSADVQGPVSSTSLYSGYGDVLYASTSNLYVVTTSWTDQSETSKIYKFNLDGAEVKLEATGTVHGRVLNSFDLDEKNGLLRVVTTSGWWGSSLSSHVTVLRDDQGSLDTIGQLDGIAPGETLGGVRFIGDRAYVVTFQYTDPLFTIDLSDATKPKIAGQLTLPGNSLYIEPIDANHLIAVGRASARWSDGLKVSLFDVTDPASPRDVDDYPLTDQWTALSWGSSSEAEWDHHAFSYFADTKTLAIPVFDGLTNNMFHYNVSSMWVFDVSLDTGFALRGRIEHDSNVHRSIEIGDQIYTMADDSVQKHAVLDPAAQGQEVRYTDNPRFPLFVPYVTLGAAVPANFVTFHISNPANLHASISINGGTDHEATLTPMPDGTVGVSTDEVFSQPGANTANVTITRDGSQIGILSSSIVVNVPADRFVDALYRDLLHRRRAKGTENGWDSLLTQQGVSRAMVTVGILHSHEYEARAINDLYLKYLGRQAEAFGLNGWLSALDHGATIEQISAGILGSNEYFARQGGSAQPFLQHLYQDLLDRALDGSGSMAWGQALQNGASRGNIAWSILQSEESATNQVQAWYATFLHRQADPTGLQTWVSVLQSGAARESVLATIIGSQEYLGTV